MIAPIPSRGYQKLALGALVVSIFYFLYTSLTSASLRLDEFTSPAAIPDAPASEHVPAIATEHSPQPSAHSYAGEEESGKEEDTQNTGAIAEPQSSPSPSAEPGDDSVDGVIVMGKMEHEDTTWIERLSHWQHAVYSVNNTDAPLHTTMNKGREAMPYLTYIVDHYHSLPKNLVFLHSHENGYPVGWHTDTPDHSNIWSVEHLNLDFLQRNGYANLRCIYIPGCPDEIQPFRDDKFTDRSTERVMGAAWRVLFENDDVPEVIGAPCCAQFAVSRDQVLKRPQSDYIRFRQWLINTELSDEISGRVFEYLWHIIFGQVPVYCPELGQCYNDVYSGDQVPPEGYEIPDWISSKEQT